MSTPNLALAHIASNQASKEVTANASFDGLDKALAGLLAKAFPSDANLTLSSAEALGSLAIKFTGSISATRNVVVPNNKKLYFICNGTTGGQSIVVKTSAGTGITITNDATTYRFVYCDGTNVVTTASLTAGSVTESDLSLSDVTTDNVTSTKHGFAPKSPADATQFLNGAATPAFAAVKDSDLSTSDITTNNVSTSKHGFAPKAPNVATQYLDGTGAYSTPAGTGVVAINTQTASYTAVLADGNTLVRMNVGSANNFTVPPNSSVAFAVGTCISVRQTGAGATTIVAGAGVTINNPGSSLVIRKQQATIQLIKVATDTWDLMGDITGA